ncbi:hypothetical protein HN592_04305 [Candidatus Woesearchaeota archaeon]|jgi:hypothetical protein|nr:hypothetical protein [Candidatus Woesearchaeota archaeon]MBT4368435.1 hypothetical protein [Candidatus Woesearchaeota archaeon]MBT4712924.1 hypothetical protein [Candidatus Woesearchaeota archaeon]MBT6639836.1 hypothetical protein [Candidatus Woesearchaeota archaeon]MBT7134008.1 hypothetical protein [Candidatus Woesearchaeota archaeon]
MFGLGKKKEEDNLPPEGDTPFPPMDGEGKFPPPEQAFDEPTPLDGLSKPEFPSTPMETPQTSFEIQKPQPLQPTQAAPQLTGDRIEIVIAKIDALKSMMEVLNQRIANIESRLAQNERRW